jgi:hypothetical protein
MSLHKLFGFLVLAGAGLLAGCGGGADGEGSSGGNSSNGSVTTVLQGQVYMAGGFVEGLTYSTATQSGTTGPKGFFKYIPGEEITFKVGNLSLKTYEIKGNARYLTHFDILGTLNPNDTEIKNLSVLLHWLDVALAQDVATGHTDHVAAHGRPRGEFAYRICRLLPFIKI